MFRATFFTYSRYSFMFRQMINNMLGEYSKFVELQDDGSIKVFVPEDVNNPSISSSKEMILTQKEAINLMGLITQPKQYEVNGVIVSEKDTNFDINKWVRLAIGSIKS